VEEGGERWSKPHVATLSLHALFELRRGLSAGTVMLDAEAMNIAQVSGALSNRYQMTATISLRFRLTDNHKRLLAYTRGVFMGWGLAHPLLGVHKNKLY